MKRFYENSFQLWVIARVLIILFYIFRVCQAYRLLKYIDIFVFALFFIPLAYIICMAVLMYHELNNSQLPFLLRSFTGGLSALIAFGWLLTFSTGGGILHLFAALWFAVYALYDILNVKNEYH